MNDVQAGNAEIANIIADQPWDVVVAHQQQIHRHVFAITKQLVFTLRELQATAGQQIERVIRQAA